MGELVADGLTKALSGQAFVKHRDMLGVVDWNLEKKEEKVLEEEKAHEEEKGEGLRRKAETVVAAIGGILIAAKRVKVGLAMMACAAALRSYNVQRKRSVEEKQVGEQPRVRMLWLGSDPEGDQRPVTPRVTDENNTQEQNQEPTPTSLDHRTPWELVEVDVREVRQGTRTSAGGLGT